MIKMTQHVMVKARPEDRVSAFGVDRPTF